MVLIRRVEEMAAKAYTERKILGFCHLYIGQESVAVGAAAACRPEDRWITGYREHGQAMAKGVNPRALMAELFGKATGTTRGLGGSMHIFDKNVHFMGGLHSMSDPAKYRPAGELEEKKNSDPIVITEQRLRALGLGDADFEAVRERVELQAKDAYDYADASPIPDPATLYDYTYAPSES